MREPEATWPASSNLALASARTGGEGQAEGTPAMLRLARPVDRVRPAGTALAAVARARVIGPVARRKTALVLAGTTLALVSAGSVSVAMSPGSAPLAAGAAAARLQKVTGTPWPHFVGGVHVTAELLHPRITHHAPAPASKPAAPPVSIDPWQRVRAAFSGPSTPAAAAELTPAGTSGPQGWMPISGAQYANATTIVRQVLARKMGVRSAVIAIATAMQESRLLNLGYGDADSLGLFQQRPSAGWGTSQQLLDPAYAANAFLIALQRHQQADPGWATRPLWATAQAVQASGFPTAYARWESQAAGMVKEIASNLM